MNPGQFLLQRYVFWKKCFMAPKLSKFHLNVFNVIQNIYDFLSLSWIIFNQYYHSPHVASVHLLACKFYGFDNLHVGFFIFVIYYLSCQLSKQCRGAWSFCVRIDVLNAHPIKCASRQDKKKVKLNLSTSFKVSKKHFFKPENYIIYVHVSYLYK